MKYTLIKQKPYCCVPACLQIILQSRNLKYPEQIQIGRNLGLIMPKEGKMPISGYGTQVGKKQHSINSFFQKLDYPLTEKYYYFTNYKVVIDKIKSWLANGLNIIVCYNQKNLFANEENTGHVSIIESIKDSTVVIIDPQRNKRFEISIGRLTQAIKTHGRQKRAGFWIIGKN